MRQVSPGSVDIFDFILQLDSACLGNWEALVAQGNISPSELEAFLNYAATFLSNLGNYFVRAPDHCLDGWQLCDRRR